MGSRWYTSDLHQSPLTFQHLSHCDTKACIPALKKSLSSICSQEVIACFMSMSSTNHLPARCFLRVSNRWDLLGRKLGLQGSSPIKSPVIAKYFTSLSQTSSAGRCRGCTKSFPSLTVLGYSSHSVPFNFPSIQNLLLL
jgi:hypothetical protein